MMRMVMVMRAIQVMIMKIDKPAHLIITSRLFLDLLLILIDKLIKNMN